MGLLDNLKGIGNKIFVIDTEVLIKAKGFEKGTAQEFINNLDELEYTKEEAFEFKSKFLGLLKTVNTNNPYLIRGLENMMDIMSNNKPLTSAPRDNAEREAFYFKLAKGYRFLSDLIEKQYKSDKMDNADVFYCINEVGRGGHACAGRWKQVLESFINSFEASILDGHNLTVDPKDIFENSLKDSFTQARKIVGHKLAEEFVTKNDFTHTDIKLHYTDFFLRYLNEKHDFNVSVISDTDSYLERMRQSLEAKIKTFLLHKHLDELVYRKVVDIIAGEIEDKPDIYNAVLDWAEKKYKNTDIKDKFEDVGDYLSEEIFRGFSKKIKPHALDEMLTDMKFVEFSHKEFEYNKKDALFEALFENKPRHVKGIIEKGVDIDFQFEKGVTILLIAARKNNVEFCRALIEARANVNIPNQNGDKPLIVSMVDKKYEISKLLIENGAQLNDQQKDGNTALILAVKNMKDGIARLLIQKGADVNIKNRSGNSALSYAIKTGNVEMTRLLLENNADINNLKCNFFNREPSALINAINSGKTEIVEMLIEKGFDINVTNKSGKSAFILAVENRQYDIAQLLIEKGVDINQTDKDGNKPLSFSIMKGYEDITKLLLENNASKNDVVINFRNQDKDPLFNSFNKNTDELTKLFIENGFNLNNKNGSGNTVLIEAIKASRNEIAKLLIENNADINIKNTSGSSALSYAIKYDNAEMVKMLVDNGASLSEIKLKFGKLESDKVQERKKIINILKDKGVNIESLNKKKNNFSRYALLRKLSNLRIGKERNGV